MLASNRKICLTGDEAIAVLTEIELILISLHRMGSTYPDGGGEYERETTRFIDEWRVCHRLSSMRKIIEAKFDDALGDDNMDDIERAVQFLPYWKTSDTKAPKS